MRDILQPVMCGPKMGITKDRKLGVMSKKCLHSKMVQNYGNRSAGFCLVMQAVGQAGHFLNICILRSLWSGRQSNKQNSPPASHAREPKKRT